MVIKVKCWNNEIKDWDQCAYPLFKGSNPCEVIGFQDSEGSDKLIVDGHDVVLCSGLIDKNKVELYENDICKSTVYDNELYVVKYSNTAGQWYLHLIVKGVVMNNVRYMDWYSMGDIYKIGSKYENPKYIK